MLAKLFSYSLWGIEARVVEVEVDISPAALPRTTLVGLAEAAVKESTHRIERAVVNSGFQPAVDRTVINLSPADFPKDAASLDLPIAMGILAATGQMPVDQFSSYALVGELALDGSVRPARGVLSMAIAARSQKLKGILVPVANFKEAAVVDGIDVIPIGSLTEAAAFLAQRLDIPPARFSWSEAIAELGTANIDYSDVKGQEFAKRALTIAAAGAHHLLMIGPPGSGKTLLASRLATILPPLSLEEALETTRIHSASGLLRDDTPLVMIRPFREPHHTVSQAGLVGGGSVPKAGEISLAHNGVLFLDELPEFDRRTLEVLREPLEEQRVTITRALGTTTFPADFMLVAAMNPTPSGHAPEPGRNVSSAAMRRYLATISGPLLDRIDLHIEVPAVPFRELAGKKPGTDSTTMREQVLRAREQQTRRFADSPTRFNGRMTPREIRQHCGLDGEGEALLQAAMTELKLSARAHDRILRVTRTIADLEGSEQLSAVHLSEAINYRSLESKYWS